MTCFQEYFIRRVRHSFYKRLRIQVSRTRHNVSQVDMRWLHVSLIRGTYSLTYSHETICMSADRKCLHVVCTINDVVCKVFMEATSRYDKHPYHTMVYIEAVATQREKIDIFHKNMKQKRKIPRNDCGSCTGSPRFV